MPRTVDVYCRVSRIGAREHLISPEEQERDARSFAERRGLTVGEVFTDLDRSGGTLDRPGLQRALERVRSGASSGIVVAYLSRLTRETSQGLALLEEVRAAGGEVYAPNLSDHTTADGRMLNTIQLAIDAGMRERATEQIDRARELAIANGVVVSSRTAVGYLRNAERGYEPDPATAPIVREVFERRARGAGPSELARLLEDNGVLTSQGSSTWTVQAVNGLIRSRTYLGELRSGRHVNPAAHEPLVSRTTWAAAQNPSPAPPRKSRGGYLLSGTLRCLSCGYCMQGTTTSRGKRIYRCIRRHAGGICPAPARIDADVVDGIVLDEVRGKIQVRRPPVVVAATADLEDAYARAERLLAQALTPEVQEAAGENWATMISERRGVRDAAAEALGSARASVQTSSSFWDAYRSLDVDNASQEELREVIAGLFAYVAVDRDKTIHWPPGDDDPPAQLLSRRGFNREARLNPLPANPRDEP